MTSLNSEIIGKYAKSRKQIQTDHSDFSYDYTFENGMILSSLYISEGKPIEQDSLEGYDGYIYIDTEQELKELIRFDIDLLELNPEEAAIQLKQLCQ
jgi:hypothetical protein